MRSFKNNFVRTMLASILVITLPASVFASSPTQYLQGRGSDVPSVRKITSAVLITGTYNGSSNFIVHPVYKDGSEGVSWFNEIGNFSGTVFQEKPYTPIVAASVDAIGKWSLTIKPLSYAPRMHSSNFSGRGNTVVRLSKRVAGFKRAKLTHKGSSNFIVHPISPDGSEDVSMVNEIGRYSGTVLIPSGTQYLEIVADGKWTVSIK